MNKWSILFLSFLGIIFILFHIYFKDASTKVLLLTFPIGLLLIYSFILLNRILNDKLWDPRFERIILDADSITIKSKYTDQNIELPINEISELRVDYRGYDQSPQKNSLNFFKATSGAKNYLTIHDKEGRITIIEVYFENENQTKRLRNIIEYYKINGINAIIIKQPLTRTV